MAKFKKRQKPGVSVFYHNPAITKPLVLNSYIYTTVGLTLQPNAYNEVIIPSASGNLTMHLPQVSKCNASTITFVNQSSYEVFFTPYAGDTSNFYAASPSTSSTILATVVAGQGTWVKVSSMEI